MANSSDSTCFRFIDLFAGIGGMRLGLEGLNTLNGQCVWSCERDKFSRKTYRANFPEKKDHPAHRFESDIHDVDVTKIPDHDVLAAGFPCQPFSLAGVSKKNALSQPHGFDCYDQGNLFFKIVNILETKRPPVFLLENVKNLRSHDKGNTFETMTNCLKNELGYEVHSEIINAKPWTPQNRERIFMVGFDTRKDFDWSTFSFQQLAVPRDPRPTLKNILHPRIHRGRSEAHQPGYTDERTRKALPKYVITEHLWRYLRDYKTKHRRLGNGFGFGLAGPVDTARTLSARYYKDGSEILIKTKGPGPPRRLTPRECARLMGFPARFKIPVSDTQAYRQFGNAVVVPVVTAIARLLEPILTEIVHRRTN